MFLVWQQDLGGVWLHTNPSQWQKVSYQLVTLI